jgi:hypothetical protein
LIKDYWLCVNHSLAKIGKIFLKPVLQIEKEVYLLLSVRKPLRRMKRMTRPVLRREPRMLVRTRRMTNATSVPSSRYSPSARYEYV